MSASAARIPFKAESSIGVGQMVGVLGITLILLALAFALLVYARKKGWLNRWSAAGLEASGATRQIAWKAKSQRISRQTTVHTLSRQDRTLVIVESGTNVAVATWLVEENVEDGHADAQR